MGELWRDLVEVLGKRPILWLPVLVADLLAFLANISRISLLHSFVMHQTTQQSVFGGAVVHGNMSGSAMAGTTVFAVLLSWLVNFLRILLYAAALSATAALVRAYLDRRNQASTTLGQSLANDRGMILELALRTLAVYAILALLFSWIAPALVNHGHAAIARSPWFNLSASLLVLIILAWSVTPAALRLLSGGGLSPALIRRGQVFAIILVAVATLLSAIVGANGRELAGVAPAGRYPLEAVASLLVALPYVLLFTGLTLLARKASLERADA